MHSCQPDEKWMWDRWANALEACVKFCSHAHFCIATPTILAMSATTHNIHLPCPLNLEIYRQKLGSILKLACATPLLCIIRSDVLWCQQRGNLGQEQDIFNIFGTIWPVSGQLATMFMCMCKMSRILLCTLTPKPWFRGWQNTSKNDTYLNVPPYYKS